MNEQTKHTQGPWSATAYDVYAPSGVCIVNVKSTKNLPCAANAARIVACVNACEGISNEMLSLGGPFAAARAALTERDHSEQREYEAQGTINALRAANAELVEALRDLCGLYASGYPLCDVAVVRSLAVARAALAKHGAQA